MEKLSYGGMDVSKDRLDVVVLPEGWFFSVSNDTAGWAELVARLRPLAVSAIGLEPSGGYVARRRSRLRARRVDGLQVHDPSTENRRHSTLHDLDHRHRTSPVRIASSLRADMIFGMDRGEAPGPPGGLGHA